MTLIMAYRNRGLKRNIVMVDADGATITPGEHDVIRAIVGRERETGKLTVASNAPTGNGSTFMKGATNVLRLDEDDLMFEGGVYSLFIDFMDNADSQTWKVVDVQVFSLQDVSGVT